MRDAKRFEDWLKRAAESPEARDLLARTEAETDLPEEVLADYYAGLLSPEEERLVQSRIALSPRASLFLAQLDADVLQAAGDVAPRVPMIASLGHRVVIVFRAAARSIEPLLPSGRMLRLAASASVVVLLVFAAGRVLDRPPSEFGAAFDPTVVRRGSDIFQLPDGNVLDRVAPDWQLRTPPRRPDRVRWFSWDPVRGAALYQIELREPSGNVVYANAGIEKNHLRLPWSVRRKLKKNTEYIWIVTATGANSEPLVRAVGRFRIE